MESALYMYSIYALVVFVSEILLVRFLTRQQLVRKYRTPALSMKYSLYTPDKFSSVATFYKLECLNQYSGHFATYRVIFQTQPCVFSTRLVNFRSRFSDH